MLMGRIEVYEDNAGYIRAYVRETGVDEVIVYDCWERCDFGDLRKCVYEWLGTGVLDGVERAYRESEEEDDMRYSMLIVTADRDQYGGVDVHVAAEFMGPAGLHAWGIKEEE